jgi:hypothetical protein
MPDITMCYGLDCPFKNKCYRHTASPNPFWQSYFTEPPMKDGDCPYYYEDKSALIDKKDEN